ncbi:MAG: DUF1800 domain-containing protein [Burkholderiaceae bacterium]
MTAGSARAALDLNPIEPGNWSERHARHLASRAGFGATREEARELAAMKPANAVQKMIAGSGQSRAKLPSFDHSGVFDIGLDPFPPSRPATTDLARRQGHALGLQVRPGGNRPLQPIVDKFFYWLRASRLETDRVAYWWANRMVSSRHPLQEKMALFWHGHFATNEDKVRDYRKMLLQLQLFHRSGLGNFRDLLVQVSQDPAMLVFLDAGVNTRDSPNENFAREILELFTMGVGHYSEKDVQEAARAFTGWNVKELGFHLVKKDQDTGLKTFLGQQGRFDGIELIDLILQQPATARFIAGKLYRFFVNETISNDDQQQLGSLLKSVDFDISRFLETIFLSREFYYNKNIGSRIKSPVEFMVSTFRHLRLKTVPGVPDFNQTGEALGQRLMHPPTVAGWSRGQSWITPSLLFERSNFVLDVLSPPVGFIPPDRYPGYPSDEIVNVQNRLRQGASISVATRPTGIDSVAMADSNSLADRDEAFNTRLGTLRGWQMALERVKPILRNTARLTLADQVLKADIRDPRGVIDFLVAEFFEVPPSASRLNELAERLAAELGSKDIQASGSFLEEPLRKILHQLLSEPEYQLG